MYHLLKLGVLLAGLFYPFFVTAQVCPSDASTPKVLIAGDSWAQYMWDDDAHNIIFDKFGYADQDMLSESLGANPGAGYAGSEYAVSGSEAREWADPTNYPWIANVVAALSANPTIETVVLSIGGNDILAAKSGGGWYKDMDLDNAGSEEALFSTIEANTQVIIDAILAVRPNINVLLSSYDFVNFNVNGFFCGFYACPKRDDLSRDSDNDLITDMELNQLMVTVEQRRLNAANAQDRVYYDNSVGLMHHYYGDGQSAPGVLPRPGTEAPDHLPFPGGDISNPALRDNFRNIADPIHLDAAGYQYKVAQQVDSYFLERFIGSSSPLDFRSEGGNNDGWVTENDMGTDAIYVGDDGTAAYKGIISFDKSQWTFSTSINEAALYIIRKSSSGGNPFTNIDFGEVQIEVKDGTFGSAAVEIADATEAATATEVGCFHGTANGDHYTLRIDLNQAAIDALNSGNDRVQFRISFPTMNSGTNEDAIVFYDGDDTTLPPASGNPIPHRGLINDSNNAAPFLRINNNAADALPIVLSSFDAYKSDHTTELTWRSEREINSQHFIIERFEQEEEWKALGTVSAKNSNTSTSYTFTDTNPKKGLNYYRLKMLDQDGSFTYSTTRAVYFPLTHPIVKVYPNPFVQELTVEITGEQQDVLTLQVVDVFGKVVAIQSIELAQDGLNILPLTLPNHLAAGNYMLMILGEHVQRTFKIIKR